MKCQICFSKSNQLKKFSNIPRAFDFKKKNKLKDDKFDLLLFQCLNCLTIQLKKSGKDSSFISKIKWIQNKEPSQHLDYINKKIIYKKPRETKILFLSRFDKTVYEEFFKKKNLFDYKPEILEMHLALSNKYPNQHEIINKISKEGAKIQKKIGKFDLIVSCRLLEHAYEFKNFLSVVSLFLKNNGEFIFEIPDSSKPLKHGDLGMLWEEHPYYFTKNSFTLAMNKLGLGVSKVKRFPYLGEDALIFIVKKKLGTSKKNIIKQELNVSKLFVKKINDYEISFQKLVQTIKEEKNNNIFFFGAGHRTVTLVNTLKINKKINEIIDDDTRKKNLIFPGCNLKIKNSLILKNYKSGFCFLSVNTSLENIIIKKLKKINKKIIFYSMAPESKLFYKKY